MLNHIIRRNPRKETETFSYGTGCPVCVPDELLVGPRPHEQISGPAASASRGLFSFKDIGVRHRVGGSDEPGLRGGSSRHCAFGADRLAGWNTKATERSEGDPLALLPSRADRVRGQRDSRRNRS